MSSPNNDPWSPMQSTPLQAPTVDPLRQMISSEQYIESLERKLGRLKGKSGREPSAGDMIASLEQTRAAQMSAFMRNSCQVSSLEPVYADEEPSGSFLSRKLHPEKQALNPEEVAPLLKEDELSQQQEHQQEQQKQQQSQQEQQQGQNHQQQPQDYKSEQQPQAERQETGEASSAEQIQAAEAK